LALETKVSKSYMEKIHQKLLKENGWYAFWHKQKGHQLAAWCVVALVGIFFAGLIIARANNMVALQGMSSQASAGTPASKTKSSAAVKKVLPTVRTTQTYSITSASATLTGVLTTNGLPATWWFEYGETDSLGNSTPEKLNKSTIKGFNSSTSFYIKGLQPQTTYYYQLNASNVNGSVHAQTLRFRTR
jgi:hypothetical protein